MEIFADGRVYVSKGEDLPLKCPECEHVMEFRATDGLTTCEKCDCRGTVADFSKVQWVLTKVN